MDADDLRGQVAVAPPIQGCRLRDAAHLEEMGTLHALLGHLVDNERDPRVALDVAVLGALSHRSGVAVSTLHFYETKGLITSSRTSGNQRRYPRDTLRRVAFIRTSQSVGIPLRQIKEALDRLPDGRTPTRRDWERLSSAWRDDLDDRITRLQHLRDKLSGCIGCGCLSLRLCKLMNPDDMLAQNGPGAHNL